MHDSGVTVAESSVQIVPKKKLFAFAIFNQNMLFFWN